MTDGVDGEVAATARTTQVSARDRYAGFAFDATVVLTFALAGYLLYLGAWQRQDQVLGLESDAGNIAGFIAATERPDLFTRDEALGNPRNFAHYLTVQIPTAIYLSRFTNGDYGRAFLLPVPLLGALQGVGFYLLGLLVLRSRWLAFVLAACGVLVIELPTLAEYWGMKGHGTPREWFQSLLPYVLWAAWRWRTDPRAWAAILFAMGLMMYVHPVSSPGWTAALWLGFLLCRPEGRTWRRQFSLLFACTPAFFVAAMPFVLNYLGEHEHGASPVPYEQVYAILKYRFSAGYLDLPMAIGKIGRSWIQLGLIPAAVAGLLVTWRFAPERRDDLRLLCVWLSGLLLMATIVPVVEQELAAAMRMIPVEVDLVRGLRYVIPLAQLSALLGVSVALQHVPPKWQSATQGAAAAALLLAVTSLHSPDKTLTRGVALARSDKQPALSKRHEMLLKVRELTPEGAALMPSDDDDALPLRFLSRRAVVYAWKDGGILAYANHEALAEWYVKAKKVRRLRKTPESKRTPTLFKLARAYGADYVLFDGDLPDEMTSELRADVVYRNTGYMLLKLN